MELFRRFVLFSLSILKIIIIIIKYSGSKKR